MLAVSCFAEEVFPEAASRLHGCPAGSLEYLRRQFQQGWPTIDCCLLPRRRVNASDPRIAVIIDDPNGLKTTQLFDTVGTYCAVGIRNH